MTKSLMYFRWGAAWPSGCQKVQQQNLRPSTYMVPPNNTADACILTSTCACIPGFCLLILILNRLLHGQIKEPGTAESKAEPPVGVWGEAPRS